MSLMNTTLVLKKGDNVVSFKASGAGYSVHDTRTGKIEYMGRYGAIDWAHALRASGWR